MPAAQSNLPSATVLRSIERRAVRQVLRSVVVQGIAGCLVGLVAFGIGGVAAGVSALIGAASYFLPNALLALRLLLSLQAGGRQGGAVVLVGEFLKVGGCIALLWLAAWLGSDQIVWPAVLAGLVVVLKSYIWLALLKDF